MNSEINQNFNHASKYTAPHLIRPSTKFQCNITSYWIFVLYKFIFKLYIYQQKKTCIYMYIDTSQSHISESPSRQRVWTPTRTSVLLTYSTSPNIQLIFSLEGIEAAAAGATLMPRSAAVSRPSSCTGRGPPTTESVKDGRHMLHHSGPNYILLFHSVPDQKHGLGIPLFAGVLGRAE